MLVDYNKAFAEMRLEKLTMVFTCSPLYTTYSGNISPPLLGRPMMEWWPGGAWAIFIALNCRKDLPSVTRHRISCLQSQKHKTSDPKQNPISMTGAVNCYDWAKNNIYIQFLWHCHFRLNASALGNFMVIS